jgi:ADP-heptose:LPS heptosyltransferase
VTVATKRLRGRPRVVIHAGASREYQRWLPERFAALAQELARDCDVTWIAREEVSIAAPAGVEVFPPSDLGALVCLFAGVDLFVGNHSGAFHLAAALGKKCVVIAGPSPLPCDPPWHRERHRILRAPGLACLPCEQLNVTVDVCRNFSTPMACMKHWSADAVAAVCRDALRASAGDTAPP